MKLANQLFVLMGLLLPLVSFCQTDKAVCEKVGSNAIKKKERTYQWQQWDIVDEHFEKALDTFILDLEEGANIKIESKYPKLIYLLDRSTSDSTYIVLSFTQTVMPRVFDSTFTEVILFDYKEPDLSMHYKDYEVLAYGVKTTSNLYSILRNTETKFEVVLPYYVDNKGAEIFYISAGFYRKVYIE